MKVLHTSDWHVGKSLRGNPRIEEHRAVLAEVAQVAEREAVDIVLVTGDLFDSAAPGTDAQQVVWHALLALRATGAQVVVIGGNHDNQRALDAFAPVLEAAGITLRGRLARPDEGGVIDIAGRDGTPARVALLPWVPEREAVRSEQLLALDSAQTSGHYAGRMQQVVESLTRGFRPDDAVNIVAAHAMVRGGRRGGGEREAQTVIEYELDANIFPASVHYVALGHLHRTQQLSGATQIWYAGSPVQVDFGEENDVKHVLVVEAARGVPAKVRRVPITSGAQLRTVSGTLDELEAMAGEVGDAWLRVSVREKTRPGLADDVRALLPRAIDVRVEVSPDARTSGRVPATTREGRTPHELFELYLDATDHARDKGLVSLFDRLLAEDFEDAGV
ncbi:MAG: exonuclease subunit SbcD [Actinomycetia bacterium]|nr:exonuclease subunit SbcD [Actinomycetes bacterium]